MRTTGKFTTRGLLQTCLPRETKERMRRGVTIDAIVSTSEEKTEMEFIHRRPPTPPVPQPDLHHKPFSRPIKYTTRVWIFHRRKKRVISKAASAHVMSTGRKSLWLRRVQRTVFASQTCGSHKANCVTESVFTPSMEWVIKEMGLMLSSTSFDSPSAKVGLVFLCRERKDSGFHAKKMPSNPILRPDY